MSLNFERLGRYVGDTFTFRACLSGRNAIKLFLLVTYGFRVDVKIISCHYPMLGTQVLCPTETWAGTNQPIENLSFGAGSLCTCAYLCLKTSRQLQYNCL